MTEKEALKVVQKKFGETAKVTQQTFWLTESKTQVDLCYVWQDGTIKAIAGDWDKLVKQL